MLVWRWGDAIPTRDILPLLLEVFKTMQSSVCLACNPRPFSPFPSSISPPSTAQHTHTIQVHHYRTSTSGRNAPSDIISCTYVYTSLSIVKCHNLKTPPRRPLRPLPLAFLRVHLCVCVMCRVWVGSVVLSSARPCFSHPSSYMCVPFLPKSTLVYDPHYPSSFPPF